MGYSPRHTSKGNWCQQLFSSSCMNVRRTHMLLTPFFYLFIADNACIPKTLSLVLYLFGIEIEQDLFQDLERFLSVAPVEHLQNMKLPKIEGCRLCCCHIAVLFNDGRGQSYEKSPKRQNVSGNNYRCITIEKRRFAVFDAVRGRCSGAVLTDGRGDYLTTFWPSSMMRPRLSSVAGVPLRR